MKELTEVTEWVCIQAVSEPKDGGQHWRFKGGATVYKNNVGGLEFTSNKEKQMTRMAEVISTRKMLTPPMTGDGVEGHLTKVC